MKTNNARNIFYVSSEGYDTPKESNKIGELILKFDYLIKADKPVPKPSNVSRKY